MNKNMKFLLPIIFFFSSGFSLMDLVNPESASETSTEQPLELSAPVNKQTLVSVSEGFANIVEPLMPAVVNISVTKSSKPKSTKKKIITPFPQGSPFEEFNQFFERFSSPEQQFDGPAMKRLTSAGSGFIIDDAGHIVTNKHVIDAGDEIRVKLSNNKEYVAKVIGTDAKTDIALVKIEVDHKLPFVKFGDSQKSRVGDWVIAVGNPYGVGSTVTTGIISAISRDLQHSSLVLIDNYLQIDAAINQGNSGGPTFNLKGEVIGVNTLLLSPSGGNVGIAFAIPSSAVIKVVKDLKQNGRVLRGELGVLIQELNLEMVESLGLEKDVTGVIVASVNKGSSAEKAGIQRGDVIIEFDGQKITGIRKLKKIVATTNLEKEKLLKVRRGDSVHELKVVLTANHEGVSATVAAIDAKENQNEEGYKVQGVIIDEVTPLISKQLKIKSNDTAGVVIKEVELSSPWAKRGMLPGDIIKSVNQQPVKNLVEFKVQYEKATKSKKSNVLFMIRRGNKHLFVAMPIK